MRFTVDIVTKTSGRLGSLSQETGRTFNTPVLVQTTKSGSIPYLSKEVFNNVTKSTEILQISLANCNHMEKALEVSQKGIASFVGYDGYPSFVNFKDHCEPAPPGYHEKDTVPLFTRRGKVAMTVNSYMNLMEKFQPDFYHALCDTDTDDQSPKKRVLKSVDRSERLFKDCIEKHKNSVILQKSMFFAPIVGGYSIEMRSKCIKTILKEPSVGGYLIDGIQTNSHEYFNLVSEKVTNIVSHCLKELNSNDKPVMMPGVFSPDLVLQLIQLGVDMFDTSLVYVVVGNGQAFTFNFDLNNTIENVPYVIDLQNVKYKDDFTPLLENCDCLTCEKHTKAYINHLCNTRELLGPILLMIHNLHHYMKFFDAIRKVIADDKLPDMIDLFSRQTDFTSVGSI